MNPFLDLAGLFGIDPPGEPDRRAAINQGLLYGGAALLGSPLGDFGSFGRGLLAGTTAYQDSLKQQQEQENREFMQQLELAGISRSAEFEKQQREAEAQEQQRESARRSQALTLLNPDLRQEGELRLTQDDFWDWLDKQREGAAPEVRTVGGALYERDADGQWKQVAAAEPGPPKPTPLRQFGNTLLEWDEENQRWTTARQLPERDPREPSPLEVSRETRQLVDQVYGVLRDDAAARAGVSGSVDHQALFEQAQRIAQEQLGGRAQSPAASESVDPRVEALITSAAVSDEQKAQWRATAQGRVGSVGIEQVLDELREAIGSVSGAAVPSGAGRYSSGQFWRR